MRGSLLISEPVCGCCHVKSSSTVHWRTIIQVRKQHWLNQGFGVCDLYRFSTFNANKRTSKLEKLATLKINQ